jgi:3-oxoacyl-[acyl-carrier-protein] synthase II
VTAVVVSGVAASTAFGRGVAPLLDAVWAGRPGFAPISRFDVTGRRVGVAATAPGAPGLRTELVATIRAAAAEAGLSTAALAGTPLLLAVHGDTAGTAGTGGTAGTAGNADSGRTADTAGIAPERGHRPGGAAALAADVAAAAGTGPALRAYTSACVAASTAVAAAAAMIARGPVERLIVAAGYLVEPDQFAVFDAARVLADDGRVRPFSVDRRGLLLGDGVAAVVVESARSLHARGGEPVARLHGWASTGDAYHVCQPRPDGAGLARAVEMALARAGVPAAAVGYVNAHGSGSPQSDRAEAHALRRALGPDVPVSSTKSVHGQALEASGLVELVVTAESLRHGRLPVNAGYRAADTDCPVRVVDRPATTTTRYALTLNSAFGGANTALLVGAP